MDKVIVYYLYIWLNCKIRRLVDNQVMCRMLGILGNNPGSDLMADFQNLAITGKIKAKMEPGHFDGWGIAGFSGNKAVYLGRSKEAATESKFDSAVAQAQKTENGIILAHIRKASSGSVNLENTHPFINDGWAFGHNGNIYEHSKMPLNRLKPKGTTDSERFFCFLLEKIRGRSTIQEIKKAVMEAVSFVRNNLDYTSLTFLLANSDFLIAYRNFNECSTRSAEFDAYYTLNIAQDDDFVAVCSEPIGNLNFRPLQNKELLILT